MLSPNATANARRSTRRGQRPRNRRDDSVLVFRRSASGERRALILVEQEQKTCPIASLAIGQVSFYGCPINRSNACVTCCSPSHPAVEAATLPCRSKNTNVGVPRTRYFWTYPLAWGESTLRRTIRTLPLYCFSSVLTVGLMDWQIVHQSAWNHTRAGLFSVPPSAAWMPTRSVSKGLALTCDPSALIAPSFNATKLLAWLALDAPNRMIANATIAATVMIALRFA